MKQHRIVIIALAVASAACGANKPRPAHPASATVDEEETVTARDEGATSAPSEAEDERDPRNVVPPLPIAPP